MYYKMVNGTDISRCALRSSPVTPMLVFRFLRVAVVDDRATSRGKGSGVNLVNGPREGHSNSFKGWGSGARIFET